jgi:DNA-binding winged helix-turn-helix (wHTH) protein
VKLQFADFVIDSNSRLLTRGGEPVHLSRKAFDALLFLLDRRPNAVAKEELHDRLWPGTFVVDANLSVTMAEVRRALGDDPQESQFVRTVHRVGYAFAAEAHDVTGARTVASAPRAWLVCKERVLQLDEGENLVGREPSCRVWLDEAGVSRRHARLSLAGTAATLEDLGSKNGTWLNDRPLDGPTPLREGDRLQLGPVFLEFRTSTVSSATKTVRLSKGKKR